MKTITLTFTTALRSIPSIVQCLAVATRTHRQTIGMETWSNTSTTSKHPEQCAYDDLPEWYKTRKASEWQSISAANSGSTGTSASRVSSFYAHTSLDEAHKDNLLESICLGFWSLNFGSSPASKHLLSHWGKGRVFTGAGRTAMTVHAKKRYGLLSKKSCVVRCH